MPNWDHVINSRFNKLENIRIRRAKIAGCNRYLETEQGSFLNFTSNDYLGLSTNQILREALISAASLYGVGSTGAPSLSGYSQEADNLSQELASYLGYEKCLLFNSGFQLNLSVIPALCDKNTKVWLDKRCHASHIDGVLLAKVRFTTFNHKDIANILGQIIKDTENYHLIITEGTFSMDGSNLYLPLLADFKTQNNVNVLIMVDDAHGIGTLGLNGYGSFEQAGYKTPNADLLIGTFGKAFASHGGFICGNHNIINFLEHSARSQIYSTCLPPAILAASRASLAIVASLEGQTLRNNLLKNINYWHKIAFDHNLNIYNQQSNQSPIQLIVCETKDELDFIHNHLLAKQILVGKIAYPTVPKSEPRLRISLSAHHQQTDIQQLIETISIAQKAYHD